MSNTQILHINEDEIVAKLFNGLKIYLNPKDIAVVPHMALDGEWERSITKAWISAQLQDTVVFDVGANFGYYGLLAANMLNLKKSNVVLFEANSDLLPYIHRSFSVNWLNRNTSIEGLAISDNEGFSELTVLKDYIGCSSLHTPEHLKSYLEEEMVIEAEKTIKVKTVSIDGYCSSKKIENVDLVKLDIEGFEDKAYEGMKETITKSDRMTLFIEFTKNSYSDPEGFFDKICKDFKNIYHINEDGTLLKIEKEYRLAIRDSSDWTMLVCSKREL